MGATATTISQWKYIGEVLKRFGMSDCKTSPIVNCDLKPCTLTPSMSCLSTWRICRISNISNDLYATRIASAVGKLSRYLNKYGPAHHAAAQQVLRSAQGTQIGWVWQGKSTTGRSFKLEIKIQPTVALSSIEAEYMVKKQLPKRIASDFRYTSDAPVLIYGETLGFFR